MAREKFEDKLERLGLKDQLAAQYDNSRTFQKILAERLRQVAMESIAGTLRDRAGQPVSLPTLVEMRARLQSGTAAERDCQIYPMSARPADAAPMPGNALYIAFPEHDDGYITYETALSRGPKIMFLDEIREQIGHQPLGLQSKLEEFNLAVVERDTKKLAAFQDNILAITDANGDTERRSDALEASLGAFVGDQRRQAAWATDVSLVALADALDVNLVLCKVTPQGAVTSEQRLNNNSYDIDKPTVYVSGGDGHWDAVVDCKTDASGKVLSGRKVSAVGDGNCGYNAIALGLAAITGSRNAPAPAVAGPSARAPSGAEKVTKAEPWKEKLKSILATAHGASRKADMKLIQEAAIGDGSLESIVRQKILETQQTALPEQLRQLTNTEPKKTRDEGAPSELSPEQQAIEKQIKADETLAWELAGQEALKDDESDEESSQFRP